MTKTPKATPQIERGTLLTGTLVRKSSARNTAGKIRARHEGREVELFVYLPDDPPTKWWDQVCTYDKIRVEVTESSRTSGISGNCKALPLKDQLNGLKRSIRDRESGFYEKGGSKKLTYNISLDDHAELTHLTRLMKKDDPSIRQEDVCRDLLSQSLKPVKISRLQSLDAQPKRNRGASP